MTCNEVQNLIEMYVLEALENNECEKVRKHLSVCTVCSSIESEYRFVCKKIHDNLMDDEENLFFANKVITNSNAEIKNFFKPNISGKFLTKSLSFAACIALILSFFIESHNSKENQEQVLQYESIPHAVSAFFTTRLDNPEHSSLRTLLKDNTLIINKNKIITVIEEDSGFKAACINTSDQSISWKSIAGCLGYFTLDDNLLYYIRYNEKSHLSLVACDVETGKIIWQCNSSVDDIASITLTPPTVIENRNLCWVIGNSILLVNKSDGKKKWERFLANENVLSSAKSNNKTMFIAGNHGLYSINISSGLAQIQYGYDCKACTNNPVFLEVIENDYYISLALADGTSRLMCFDSYGQIKWDKRAPRITHLYSLNDQLLIRCQYVYSINKSSGDPEWCYEAKGCSPLNICDNMIVFVDQMENGKLTALELETGSKIWELKGFRSCNEFLKVEQKGFLKTADGVLHEIIFG